MTLVSKHSKYFGSKETSIFRPFGLLGFYSWQTNDELNLQNDALLYALGTELERDNWLFSTSWARYFGYKEKNDSQCNSTLSLGRILTKKLYDSNMLMDYGTGTTKLLS